MTVDGSLLLSCSGLSNSYSGVPVLKDVDFEMTRGEVHALVGENGAGKSTLIKILTGVVRRDAGDVTFDGRPIALNHTKADAQALGIAVIYQELSLIPGLTVAQNIYLTREPKRLGIINHRRMNREAQELIDHHGFPLVATDPIDRLSIAQRQLVEILKALSSKASLIIMDEPTSSLSMSEATQLFGIVSQLRERGISVLYISHRMEEVYSLADRVTVLRDGRKVALLDERDHMTPAKIIQLMIGRELTQTEASHELVNRNADVVLHADKLTSAGRFYDISFDLRRGEILGFAGLVGSGRTELMRAIYGADSYDSGSITLRDRRYKPSVRNALRQGIGLVPEDRRQQGIMPGASISDNISISNLDAISRAYFINNAKEAALCKRGIGLLRIKPAVPSAKVGNLSGGNQQKVVVAKWLVRQLDVLIVDEPTAGIDVGAKDELYATIASLARDGASVIFVSSDLVELTRLSHRILVLRGGRIVHEFSSGRVTEEAVLRAASGLDVSDLSSGWL